MGYKASGRARPFFVDENDGQCRKLQRMWFTSALEEHAYGHIHVGFTNIWNKRKPTCHLAGSITKVQHFGQVYHSRGHAASEPPVKWSSPKLSYYAVIKHRLHSNNLMTARCIERSSYATLFLLQVVVQAYHPNFSKYRDIKKKIII